MNFETTLPEYVSVERSERGSNLGISCADYRLLSCTSLGITEGLGATMAVSRLRCEQGCALHIWTSNRYLIIQINSAAKQLGLFVGDDLDSPLEPFCVLESENSPLDWRELGRIARAQIVGGSP